MYDLLSLFHPPSPLSCSLTSPLSLSLFYSLSSYSLPLLPSPLLLSIGIHSQKTQQ